MPHWPPEARVQVRYSAQKVRDCHGEDQELRNSRDAKVWIDACKTSALMIMMPTATTKTRNQGNVSHQTVRNALRIASRLNSTRRLNDSR